MRAPIGNARFVRIQAPEIEVSSNVAAARLVVPDSSQKISATAHITMRGSI